MFFTTCRVKFGYEWGDFPLYPCLMSTTTTHVNLPHAVGGGGGGVVGVAFPLPEVGPEDIQPVLLRQSAPAGPTGGVGRAT